MKYQALLTFFALIFALGINQSCVSTNNDSVIDTDQSVDGDKDAVRNSQHYTNLVDILRKKHSVQIIGAGRNAHAILRGIQSIQDVSYPLYYVDNVRMGRSLPQVSGTVDASRVKRVEVISGLSELASYGYDGRNGVIKIFTTKS